MFLSCPIKNISYYVEPQVVLLAQFIMQKSDIKNIHLFIHLRFCHCVIHSFIRSFIHSFIHSFGFLSLCYPFSQSVSHSFIHSSIHSFIHSSIRDERMKPWINILIIVIGSHSRRARTKIVFRLLVRTSSDDILLYLLFSLATFPDYFQIPVDWCCARDCFVLLMLPKFCISVVYFWCTVIWLDQGY